MGRIQEIIKRGWGTVYYKVRYLCNFQGTGVAQ